MGPEVTSTAVYRHRISKMAKKKSANEPSTNGNAPASSAELNHELLHSMLLQRRFEERMRRGVRARQDRRLLPSVHRPGSGEHRCALVAPPRRLRHHDLSRPRPGARPRHVAAHGDGRAVRPHRRLRARQGRLDAHVRQEPQLPRRPRHRRRARAAGDRRRRSRSSIAAAIRCASASWANRWSTPARSTRR